MELGDGWLGGCGNRETGLQVWLGAELGWVGLACKSVWELGEEGAATDGLGAATEGLACRSGR